MSNDNTPLLVERNESGFWVRAEQIDRAKTALNMGYVLDESATPVVLTGTLVDTALATIPLPGGLLGPFGSISIECLWSRVASANSIVVGAGIGTFIQSTGLILSGAGIVAGRSSQWIWSRGETAQITHHPTHPVGGAGSGSPLVIGAIDTRQNQSVHIRCTLTNIADTATLEAWRVIVYPT